MAWTPIAVHQIDRETPTFDEIPIAVVLVGVGDGSSFENEGHLTFVAVRNGANVMNLTIYIPFTVDGQAVTDQVYAIGANTNYLLGPFPTQWYNQADGTVHMNVSDDTNGTYAVWRLQG